jgi:putative transposase
MGSTYTYLLTHIVFSTKDRVPYLSAENRESVFAYIGGITREIGLTALNIGGYSDHVHLFVRMPASANLADAIRIIKTNSSRWIHDQNILDPSFAWQEGYAAFSVSESCAANVSRYIENQADHHRKVSFQEELIAYLKKHRIPYDERYIWL